MSKFQRCLAFIVFILFEAYAGYRLLTAPADFSSSAVTVFGVCQFASAKQISQAASDSGSGRDHKLCRMYHAVCDWNGASYG